MDARGLVTVPCLSQDVNIVVSGMIARVMVAQRFVNSSKNWIEATYVFPLPDESMVDHMNLMVGERRIEGKICAHQIFTFENIHCRLALGRGIVDVQVHLV